MEPAPGANFYRFASCHISYPSVNAPVKYFWGALQCDSQPLSTLRSKVLGRLVAKLDYYT
jgi:hypothetical protein